jgi:hypothetical protein
MLKMQVKVLPHGKDLPMPKYISAHAAGKGFCYNVVKVIVITIGGENG